MTAVEWLEEQLTYKYEGQTLNKFYDWEDITEIYKQAKEMEKQQIIEISDEEIEKEAKQTYREHPNNPKEHPNWTYGKDVNFARKQKAFIKGAKWHREQLKKK